MKPKYIVFDLDDTLTYEIDYLKSGFQEIASQICSEKEKAAKLYEQMWAVYQEGGNAFAYVCGRYPTLSLEELLEVYRYHFPSITLIEGAQEVLDWCKQHCYKVGLITDGRERTQRNKLKALGIEAFFDKIVISESFGSTKPDVRNYQAFTTEDISDYYYIADNPAKDFIAPNALKWTSICLLDQGKNIHPQDFQVAPAQLPTYRIKKLKELIDLIEL
nr:HAD family hydrolase [uncultured Capnocytophaga sp.]